MINTPAPQYYATYISENMVNLLNCSKKPCRIEIWNYHEQFDSVFLVSQLSIQRRSEQLDIFSLEGFEAISLDLVAAVEKVLKTVVQVKSSDFGQVAR